MILLMCRCGARECLVVVRGSYNFYRKFMNVLQLAFHRRPMTVTFRTRHPPLVAEVVLRGLGLW